MVNTQLDNANCDFKKKLKKNIKKCLFIKNMFISLAYQNNKTNRNYGNFNKSIFKRE